METLDAEFEADRLEEEAFRQATPCQKAFLIWKQVFDAKKYCFLSLLVSLILIIQLVAFIDPPDFLVKAASRKAVKVICNLFVAGNNETELGRKCLSLSAAGDGSNLEGDPDVVDE